MSETKKASAPTLAEGNITQAKSYRQHLGRSSGNLKEQVGLLLLRLQGPLNQRQRKTGYMLFEALLGQYVAARGGVE